MKTGDWSEIEELRKVYKNGGLFFWTLFLNFFFIWEFLIEYSELQGNEYTLDSVFFQMVPWVIVLRTYRTFSGSFFKSELFGVMEVKNFHLYHKFWLPSSKIAPKVLCVRVYGHIEEFLNKNCVRISCPDIVNTNQTNEVGLSVWKYFEKPDKWFLKIFFKLSSINIVKSNIYF